MARLVFPSAADQLVYAVTGIDAPLLAKPGFKMRVYTDLACTQQADIQTLLGQPIVNAIVTVDPNSLIPLFLGPDATTPPDTLYVRPDTAISGNGSPIYAREDDRFDAFTAAVFAKLDKTALTLLPSGSINVGNSWIFKGVDETNNDTAVRIQPENADYKGLVVRGLAGQLDSLTEWQNSTGDALARINKDGAGHFGLTATAGLLYGSTFGKDVQLLNATIAVGTSNTGVVGIIIRSVLSQTANLQEWQKPDGTVLGAFTKDGIFVAQTGQFENAYSAFQPVLILKGILGQVANLIEVRDSTNATKFAVGPLGDVSNYNRVTTARSGGSAPALPAQPVAYYRFLDQDGNQRYFPGYA